MRKFSYTIMFITVYFATLLLKNAETFHHTSANQGLIKMCPPGGPAFATAWQLSCGMRKKRSTTSSSPSCTYIIFLILNFILKFILQHRIYFYYFFKSSSKFHLKIPKSLNKWHTICFLSKTGPHNSRSSF